MRTLLGFPRRGIRSKLGAMYQRQTAAPVVGQSRETETLDFKHRLKQLKSGGVDKVDLAIRIAAFANKLGGTLMVGATQKGSEPVSGTVPLTSEEVSVTIDVFDKTVQEQCSPSPQWSHTVIGMSGGSLVAFHVEPYPSTLIGVRVPGDVTQGYGGTAWVFPLRVGTNTNYLNADQIAMYMDPKIRRTVIMLSKINTGEEIVVVNSPIHGGQNVTGRLEKVEEDINSLRLSIGRVPIDRIESVSGQGQRWIIICAPIRAYL